MLHLFSGSSALWLCFTHTEDLPARIMNPDGSEERRTRRQIVPNTTQLVSYNNSGTQCIRGGANRIGNMKGNGNGNINVGGSEAAEQNFAALLKQVYGKGRVGDGTRTQPNSSSTTHRGENSFINTGKQTLKGLANEIGNIDGDKNGNVNLK
ncbi:hypothetical protein L6164_026162 [Bauhinia variegata]|uniref:Uncharacterized protein n=1 Tax=Bauhinia variegata TaxID=167791 RepID=A0ACB9LQU3_BAUVA|nr:hypothetical protein L6164_026162 [Bauhinia variegata]